MPPPPPVLLKELLEEVFFRLPPDEPEHLVRASSVCKPWRGILADAGFRRRYRELHGTPPVLGFFQNMPRGCRFLPASAFQPAGSDFRSWVAMDCRHGRVLFRASPNSMDIKARYEFVVWDPMTGDERRVPLPSLISFAATVLCAAEPWLPRARRAVPRGRHFYHMDKGGQSHVCLLILIRDWLVERGHLC